MCSKVFHLLQVTLQVTQCNILGHFRAMQSWSKILTTVIHFRSCQGLMLEYGAMSGYDVLHKAQFSLYFRGSFTLQCSYCIEVYQCAIICNAHCAMCIVHYALCIVQLKCAIMCNCTLCIALQSCVMYNVQLKCICAFTAPSLSSQWSDQATAALLFISLISPFSSLHLFFCFLFFIFHFTPFISTFVFTLWCISPVLIFTQFFTSMISAFFATTWNSLPTAHKAALSPFSISPDLPTEHCIIPEDNSQCTSGTHVPC